MADDKLFTPNFILLCLGNLCFSLSFFMTLPVLPLYLTGELHTSTATAGIIVALYAVAALIVRPFSGPLVDSFQRKPVLIITVSLFVVAATGYVFVVNLLLFALVRFLHGSVFCLTSTALNTLAVDTMPPARLGTGIGVFGVIVSASMALAPMVGIMVMDAFSSIAVFICSALWSTASLAILSLVRVPHRHIPPRTRPLLRLDNLFLKGAAFPALTYILLMFGYGLLTNYVSLLAKERGLEASSGIFFSCLALGLVASRAFSGWLLDRGHLSKVIVLGKAIVIISLLAFVLSGDNVPLFLGTGVCMGLGFGFTMPAYQTLFIRLADKEHVGTANSTYYLAMDIGIGLAGLSGGLIADMSSLSATFVLASALVGVGLLVFATTCRSFC